MNKDCKVSIERDANGRLSVLLTGHKDDIRMLWTMLSINVAKATKTPLPVLCAVCSAAGPAIEDLMAKENGITVDVIDTKCACWLCYFCSVCVGRGLLFGVDDIYGLHQVGMQSSSSLQIARYF